MTRPTHRPETGEHPETTDHDHHEHHENHEHHAKHERRPRRLTCSPVPETQDGASAGLQAPCAPPLSRPAAGAPQDAGHGHGHGHAHELPQGPGARRRLAIVLAITLSVTAVEVAGALLTGSLALLADAGHMLTDAAGLTLSLVVAILAERPPTARLTWGWKRAEVLSAALQATALLAIGVYVLVEGVQRLIAPAEVTGTSMIVFGAIGLAANAAAILILLSGGAHRQNMNTRAAFLEVLNDALGSVAVLVAAVAIWITGWYRADAVASIMIGTLILPRCWLLLRQAVTVLLEATPGTVDLAQVRTHILAVPHVRGLHDVHASTVATGLPVLSAHVVVEDSCFLDGHLTVMLDELQRCLAGHFDVEHSTFQFEAATHAEHEHSTHA